MNGRRLAMLACLCLVTGVAGAQDRSAAARAPEVHGMADAFAAPGVALAWGVLRGADEATTTVVIRVVTEASAFSAAALAGIDPFTQRSAVLLPLSPTAGGISARVPRVHFAEFPRTEIRLHGATPAGPSTVPTLVVFFLGVPDTTPEFASAAALEAYLADRIVRVRTNAGGKPP